MMSVSYRYSLKYPNSAQHAITVSVTTDPTNRPTLLKQSNDDQTKSSQTQYWIRETKLHAIKSRRGLRCH